MLLRQNENLSGLVWINPHFKGVGLTFAELDVLGLEGVIKPELSVG